MALWAFGRDDADQVITVGSSKGCDWQITAAGVAPLELSFLYTGEALYVSSARPHTGARVQGKRLGAEWTRLSSGTRIDVGTACIEVFVRERPGAAPPRGAGTKATTIGYAPSIIPPQVDPFAIPISRATRAYDSPFRSHEPVARPRRGESTRQLFTTPEFVFMDAHHVDMVQSPRRQHPVLTDEVSVPVSPPTARVETPAPSDDEPKEGAMANAPRTGTDVTRPTASESTNVWSIAGTEVPEFDPDMDARGLRTSLSSGHRALSSFARHALIALAVVVAYALWIIILNRL